jgi:hypothetical protein
MLHSNYDYAIVLRDFVVNEIPWLTLICVFSFSHWRTRREYLETTEELVAIRGNVQTGPHSNSADNIRHCFTGLPPEQIVISPSDTCTKGDFIGTEQHH